MPILWRNSWVPKWHSVTNLQTIYYIDCPVGTLATASLRWEPEMEARGVTFSSSSLTPIFRYFLFSSIFCWEWCLHGVVKKISKNQWPVFWQFHKIVRKEALLVEQRTLKLNLLWSDKYSHSHLNIFFQVCQWINHRMTFGSALYHGLHL